MAERSLKLEIRDMTKRYDNGDGVEHINLKIYEGEIVTMLGPSGCGKSTILHKPIWILWMTTPTRRATKICSR